MLLYSPHYIDEVIIFRNIYNRPSIYYLSIYIYIYIYIYINFFYMLLLRRYHKEIFTKGYKVIIFFCEYILFLF